MVKLMISRATLPIPDGVTVEVKARKLKVTGPRGTLTRDFKHAKVSQLQAPLFPRHLYATWHTYTLVHLNKAGASAVLSNNQAVLELFEAHFQDVRKPYESDGAVRLARNLNCGLAILLPADYFILKHGISL
eukprot:scaffold161622_cov32-Prasinocladus_malaysianus.AAC.1